MTLERMVLALGFILMCIGCMESSDEAMHSEVGRYAIVLRPLDDNITNTTATGEDVYDLRIWERRDELLKHTTYLLDTSEGRTWYYDYSLQAWIPVDRHETKVKRIKRDEKMAELELSLLKFEEERRKAELEKAPVPQVIYPK